MPKKSTTHFFLARHGETEWNRVRRLQGTLDSPLSPAGILQAKALARSCADKNIELVVSSPLGRACKTAELCSPLLGSNMLIDPSLIERHFGRWQSEYFDDLSDHKHFEHIFFRVTDKAPPGGESGIDCGRRIAQALQSIADNEQQKRILVITHGDAIRCFMAMLEQQSQCDAYSQYGNGKVFSVAFCHRQRQFEASH